MKLIIEFTFFFSFWVLGVVTYLLTKNLVVQRLFCNLAIIKKALHILAYRVDFIKVQSVPMCKGAKCVYEFAMLPGP